VPDKTSEEKIKKLEKRVENLEREILEPNLRKKLEAISDLEFRSLANQIHYFLLYAADEYIQARGLEFDEKEGRFKTFERPANAPLRKFQKSAFDEPVLPKNESEQPPTARSSRSQK
jgi:hypothetical protein